MNLLNPFPDYPVTRLKEEPGKIQGMTILTQAIVRSRSFVDQYVGQWKESDTGQKVEPLIVAVKGDYGTGKTHLLLDAVAQVQQGLSSIYPDIAILRISCHETDPVTWFKTAIGLELKRPFLQNVIVHLYAKAGQMVASESKLTKAAGKKLEEDPWSIHDLIRENLLNETGVDKQFESLLKDVCSDASEEVRKALSGLVWDETSDFSTRWLAGEKLNSLELERLRISENLSIESDTSGVLVALAAIHSYLGFPFIIIIDELEHLTRYDSANESKRNITWLKRLLENLANNQILIFVAGHWSAWEAQSDYLDRYSQLKPIELVKLTDDDVLKIVQARVSNLSSEMFGHDQAEAIAEYGEGNIRRILSLCNVLFRESDGFRLSLNGEKIRELAEQIGQRISIDDAMLRVHEILESQGLKVQREAAIAGGIQFDLIGYQADQPKVIVDLKHAVTQRDMHDYARRFREQIKEINKLFPDIIGCFISDGNIDDKLVSLLQSDQILKILWFDLNQRDIISKIATEFETALKGSPKEDIEIAHLQELTVQNEKIIRQIEMAQSSKNLEAAEQFQEQRDVLEKQLAELRNRMYARNTDLEMQLDKYDQKLSKELGALYSRLEELSQMVKSKRDMEIIAPVKEETDTKLHATYSDLTRQPSLINKIRLGGFFVRVSILSMFIAITGLLFMISFSGEFYYLYEYQIQLYSMIFLIIFLGAFGIWISFAQVETFHDYSIRNLREIYIRNVSTQDLLKADNILQNSLEQFGPLRGRKEADEKLAKAFPDVFGHLEKP